MTQYPFRITWLQYDSHAKRWLRHSLEQFATLEAAQRYVDSGNLPAGIEDIAFEERVPGTDPAPWKVVAVRDTATIAALEAERDEAAGEAAACIDFLRAELGWECFRAEGMIGPDPVSSSEKNARLLMTFLDRTGHGKRVLDRISALEAELDDLKTKYHDLEKWVGSPYDHFDYLWKSIACCPDDQLESKALEAKKHMREITGVSAQKTELRIIADEIKAHVAKIDDPYSQDPRILGGIERRLRALAEQDAPRDKSREFKQNLAERWLFPQISVGNTAVAMETVENRFERLAHEWEQETSHLSSPSVIANHPKYQAIVDLGWDVVPHLIRDLDHNKRFWFPALAAITGVRPFDPSDITSYRRMSEAWVRWGKMKGLI